MTEQEIIEGGWIEHTNGFTPCACDARVDTVWSDGDVLFDHFVEDINWYKGGFASVEYWRLHKSETKEEPKLNTHTAYKPAWGIDAAFDTPQSVNGYDELHTEDKEMYKYPQTNYVPQSDEQLKAAEKACVKSKDDKMLEFVRGGVNAVTQKNFSIADIELVRNMLEVYHNYEENK